VSLEGWPFRGAHWPSAHYWCTLFNEDDLAFPLPSAKQATFRCHTRKRTLITWSSESPELVVETGRRDAFRRLTPKRLLLR
jgi:hypothetical protein